MGPTQKEEMKLKLTGPGVLFWVDRADFQFCMSCGMRGTRHKKDMRKKGNVKLHRQNKEEIKTRRHVAK